MAHFHYLILIIVIDERLVLVIIPQEIILGRIIRPDVFDAIVNITFIFNLLQILQNLQRRTRTSCIVYQLIFCCRPWCIFKL